MKTIFPNEICDFLVSVSNHHTFSGAFGAQGAKDVAYSAVYL